MPKLYPMLSAVVVLALPIAAGGQSLAGAPRIYDAPPGYESEADGSPAIGRQVHDVRNPRHGWREAWREAWAERAPEHPKECYARVHVDASYAPPPSGPEYVWRQAPAPPGAPGPVWCLTVRPMARQPVMISPERMGWIRVLCADQVTPDRVSMIQRRLYDRGLYRGELDGRYDAATAQAVGRFQRERHIEHGGYLSYQTWGAIAALPPPAPPPAAWRQPTTFDTGVLDWSGKVRG